MSSVPEPATPGVSASTASSAGSTLSPVPAARLPLTGYALGAAGAILFASKGIIIKLAYGEGIDAETLLALRMAFSLPFYLVIGAFALRGLRVRGEALPTTRVVLQSAGVGALGYWFSSYVDFLGLHYISASFERLILFTYPLYVVLFGALLFRQPVRLKVLGTFAVAYAGLALIFAEGLMTIGADVARGASLVSVCAISFALYQLMARRLLNHIGSALFTCIAMISASVFAIGQFALLRPLGSLLVSRHMLVLGLMIAIGATVLPSFLMNAALKRISAQANSMISTVSPVATMVLAFLVLGEAASMVELAGAGLVLASIGWFTIRDSRRR
ncbi:DMT family transporter [Ancylobacter amanitiformis]|uniref:Drug/metabolite transporter (DMT)-like permease n=1 Tax=Ancylobacter amanitiformis TaxID=217069 RepID=A0ABU0LLV6_9HYPH|nr:DMT family transporter [Ancylobacter amanitiformis]MDQ0509671.1 drug/metabolite transporter (DMT)-like permease [Ancylobacter amanitiformis]